jgi:hypothetical protein
MLGDPPFPPLGYSVQTVPTEKLATALELGDVDTRDRDWADIRPFIGAHKLDGDTLTRAVHRMRPPSVPVRAPSGAVTSIPEL